MWHAAVTQVGAPQEGTASRRESSQSGDEASTPERPWCSPCGDQLHRRRDSFEVS